MYTVTIRDGESGLESTINSDTAITAPEVLSLCCSAMLALGFHGSCVCSALEGQTEEFQVSEGKVDPLDEI